MGGELPSPKALGRAVEGYFGSISRTMTATEKTPEGESPVCGDCGEPIRYVQYLFPPTESGLCLFAELSPEVWRELCRDARYAKVTDRARTRILAWCEEQLLTRGDKDVKGVVFSLQNGFGYSERGEARSDSNAAGATAGAGMSLSEKAELLAEMRREAFS